MKRYAYYNGTIAPYEELRIPLSDRSIYFGDGIYDAAIACGSYILWEKEHLLRFLGNAKKLHIEHHYTEEKISDIIHHLIEHCGFEESFVYFQLTRNSDKRMHAPKNTDDANFLITVEPYKYESYDKPLSLVTTDDLRYYYCDIKTLNLLPSVIAARKAALLGCDEAVFHRNGIVTECSHSNISILKSGTLITHKPNNLILSGITRKHLLSCCYKHGIEYNESSFTLDEMMCADEILVTSTTKLCKRVNTVDGVKVGYRDTKLAVFLCQCMEDEVVKAGFTL